MIADLKARMARHHTLAEAALRVDDMVTFDTHARLYHAAANEILARTGMEPRVD